MLDLNNIDNQVTEKNQSELDDWLNGKLDDTPDFIRCLTSGLKNKIEYSMCYIIAQHMRRSINLISYLEETEKVLYDKSQIVSKDVSELQDLYKEASKTASTSLEWVRKYMVQNKDMLSPKDEKTDVLLDMISSLSSEEMDKLMTTIQNMKKE